MVHEVETKICSSSLGSVSAAAKILSSELLVALALAMLAALAVALEMATRGFAAEASVFTKVEIVRWAGSSTTSPLDFLTRARDEAVAVTGPKKIAKVSIHSNGTITIYWLSNLITRSEPNTV